MGKLSKTKPSWKNEGILADTERVFYPNLKRWLSTGGSQRGDTFTVPWTAAAKALGAPSAWDTSRWALPAWLLRSVKTPYEVEYFLMPDLTSIPLTPHWGHLQKPPTTAEHTFWGDVPLVQTFPPCHRLFRCAQCAGPARCHHRLCCALWSLSHCSSVSLGASCSQPGWSTPGMLWRQHCWRWLVLGTSCALLQSTRKAADTQKLSGFMLRWMNADVPK